MDNDNYDNNNINQLTFFGDVDDALYYDSDPAIDIAMIINR